MEKIGIRARKEGFQSKIYRMGGEFRLDGKGEDKKGSKSASFQVLKKIIFRNDIGVLNPELEREIRELIRGEKRIFSQNREEGEYEQWFDGEGYEQISGRKLEEYVYNELLIPILIECGGSPKNILPQVEFFDRRVDFLITSKNANLVIEIDDASHDGHESKDKLRDDDFQRIMIPTLRIESNEILNNYEGVRKKIKEKIFELQIEKEKPKSSEQRLFQIASRVQAMMIYAAQWGKDAEKIYISPECFPDVLPEVVKKVVKITLANLVKLERNIAEMYGEETIFDKITTENKEGICFFRNLNKKIDADKQVLYQEIVFPFFVVNNRNVFKQKIEIIRPKRECIEYIFFYIFRFRKFRENQLDGIVRVLKKKDTIVLLPTGSGKSAIYQMLAFLIPGTVIVVEPLKSLMEDQIANLKRRGITTIFNFTGLSGEKKESVYQGLRDGNYSIIYVTPERLIMKEFRKNVFLAKENGAIFPVCAIDEAHCVSEWGHDFRVSYLNLADILREITKDRENETQATIIALTGTASNNVLMDMERDLGINESQVIRPGSFDRPEIHFKVFSVGSDEKMAALRWLIDKQIPEDFGMRDAEDLLRLRGDKTMAGIIFCVYKSGKTEFGVDAVFEELNKVGYPGLVRFYATNEDNGIKQNAQDFKDNKASLMVATKAFGMGIDKPNIRFTIHFGIPSSIEEFYQEAGRAGRDGQKSISYVILSNDAPERNEELIEEKSVDGLKKSLRQIGRKKSDDINRLLFLHQMNYDSKQIVMDTEAILQIIGGIREGKINVVATSKLEFERWQKVFFRMRILGIIQDYMIESFVNNEFLLSVQEFSIKRIIEKYRDYIGKYDQGQIETETLKLKNLKFASRNEFIVEMMRRILDFANSIFENSSRRAIGNMLRLAEEVVNIPIVKQDEVMRKKILGHLGNTFDDIIAKITKDTTSLVTAENVFINYDLNSTELLLLQIQRELQTYPEHPGLLMLSGMFEATNLETNPDIAAVDVLNGYFNATEKYAMNKKQVNKSFLDMMRVAGERALDEKKFWRFLTKIQEKMTKRMRERIFEVIPDKYVEGYFMDKLIDEEINVLNTIQDTIRLF